MNQPHDASHQPPSIQQINLGFHPVEDRLLLKLGMDDETEIVIWLTRRVVKHMWHKIHTLNLQQAILSPQDDPIFDELEALEPDLDNALESSGELDINYEQHYQPRKSVSEKPFLPESCETETVSPEITRFNFKVANGKMVQVAMNQELISALSHMLEMALKETDWDLGLAPSKYQWMPEATSHVLH